MIEGLRGPDARRSPCSARHRGRATPAAAADRRAAAGTAFFEPLTAREQLQTLASLYGVGPAVADQWLERVGLADKADTRDENLSGGQAQRLSIACALVHDPEVVFLDEPTAALDPQARRNLWAAARVNDAAGRSC